MFVSASATTKYAAASIGGDEALLDVDVAIDEHASAQRLDRRTEPADGEDRGMDPAAPARAARPARSRASRPGPSTSAAARRRCSAARLEHPQVEGQGDELLLRAVVEVALDLAAGGVGGLDDAHAGDAQLLDARAQVGLQPLVVERERRGGRRRVDELGGRVERLVVHDRRDAPAVAVHRRPCAARAALGSATARPASSTKISRSGSQ